MTRKLEELLDLPPLEKKVESEPELPIVSKESAFEEAAHILQALDHSEKVDLALTSVTGLSDHDSEMDDIAAKAIAIFNDLTDLGQNMSDAHTGKIYEVAAQMLKTALDAKDAKVNTKLKIIDLQLKKLRLDKEQHKGGASAEDLERGVEFDRNDLLKHITDAVDARESRDSDK